MAVLQMQMRMHIPSDGDSTLIQWQKILQKKKKLLFQQWQQLPTLQSSAKIRNTDFSKRESKSETDNKDGYNFRDGEKKFLIV